MKLRVAIFKKFLSLTISFGLVVTSLPARAFGRSSLAVPGMTELTDSTDLNKKNKHRTLIVDAELFVKQEKFFSEQRSLPPRLWNIMGKDIKLAHRKGTDFFESVQKHLGELWLGDVETARNAAKWFSKQGELGLIILRYALLRSKELKIIHAATVGVKRMQGRYKKEALSALVEALYLDWFFARASMRALILMEDDDADTILSKFFDIASARNNHLVKYTVDFQDISEYFVRIIMTLPTMIRTNRRFDNVFQKMSQNEARQKLLSAYKKKKGLILKPADSGNLIAWLRKLPWITNKSSLNLAKELAAIQITTVGGVALANLTEFLTERPESDFSLWYVIWHCAGDATSVDKKDNVQQADYYLYLCLGLIEHPPLHNVCGMHFAFLAVEAAEKMLESGNLTLDLCEKLKKAISDANNICTVSCPLKKEARTCSFAKKKDHMYARLNTLKQKWYAQQDRETMPDESPSTGGTGGIVRSRIEGEECVTLIEGDIEHVWEYMGSQMTFKNLMKAFEKLKEKLQTDEEIARLRALNKDNIENLQDKKIAKYLRTIYFRQDVFFANRLKDADKDPSAYNFNIRIVRGNDRLMHWEQPAGNTYTIVIDVDAFRNMTMLQEEFIEEMTHINELIIKDKTPPSRDKREIFRTILRRVPNPLYLIAELYSVNIPYSAKQALVEDFIKPEDNISPAQFIEIFDYINYEEAETELKSDSEKIIGFNSFDTAHQTHYLATLVCDNQIDYFKFSEILVRSMAGMDKQFQFNLVMAQLKLMRSSGYLM